MTPTASWPPRPAQIRTGRNGKETRRQEVKDGQVWLTRSPEGDVANGGCGCRPSDPFGMGGRPSTRALPQHIDREIRSRSSRRTAMSHPVLTPASNPPGPRDPAGAGAPVFHIGFLGDGFAHDPQCSGIESIFCTLLPGPSATASFPLGENRGKARAIGKCLRRALQAATSRFSIGPCCHRAPTPEDVLVRMWTPSGEISAKSPHRLQPLHSRRGRGRSWSQAIPRIVQPLVPGAGAL